MKRILVVCVPLMTLSLCAITTTAQQTATTDKPKYVLFHLGDGMGVGAENFNWMFTNEDIGLTLAD